MGDHNNNAKTETGTTRRSFLQSAFGVVAALLPVACTTSNKQHFLDLGEVRGNPGAHRVFAYRLGRTSRAGVSEILPVGNADGIEIYNADRFKALGLVPTIGSIHDEAQKIYREIALAVEGEMRGAHERRIYGPNHDRLAPLETLNLDDIAALGKAAQVAAAYTGAENYGRVAAKNTSGKRIYDIFSEIADNTNPQLMKMMSLLEYVQNRGDVVTRELLREPK